jgi:putative aldouronate transport system permease protein
VKLVSGSLILTGVGDHYLGGMLVNNLNRSFGSKVFDVFNHFLLVFMCFVMLYPFYYVLVASVSNPTVVATARGLLFWPKGFTLSSYERVLSNPIIGTAYGNTLFYVIVGTTLNMILTTFAAYSLSRRHLWGRSIVSALMVFTMFFSGGLIPRFLLVRNLGLLNTRWSLILPTAINTFNFIIMRTAFASMSESLEESAKLDGANDFTILFRIYVPLAKPVMAVMVLFYAVGHWNAWFWAMVYLRDRALYPLQLILREILIANDMSAMVTDVSVMDQEPIGLTIQYATIIITMLPITVLYPFLQKYFVKGMMIGSLKG